MMSFLQFLVAYPNGFSPDPMGIDGQAGGDNRVDRPTTIGTKKRTKMVVQRKAPGKPRTAPLKLANHKRPVIQQGHHDH